VSLPASELHRVNEDGVFYQKAQSSAKEMIRGARGSKRYIIDWREKNIGAAAACGVVSGVL
jgi:hypothetical protein